MEVNQGECSIGGPRVSRGSVYGLVKEKARLGFGDGGGVGRV